MPWSEVLELIWFSTFKNLTILSHYLLICILLIICLLSLGCKLNHGRDFVILSTIFSPGMLLIAWYLLSIS